MAVTDDPRIILRNANANGWTPALRDRYRHVLRRIVRETARIVDDTGSFEAESAPIKRWARLFSQEIEPLFMGMVLSGIRLALKERIPQFKFTAKALREIGTIKLKEELLLDANRTFIADWVATTAVATSKAKARALEKIFIKAVDFWDEKKGRGLTPLEIAKEIRRKGLAQTEKRAILLARTGVIWSYNEGALIKYKDEGVAAVEWHVTEDDRSCPYCNAMDGVVIPIDANFVDQGQEFTVENEDGKLVTLSQSFPFEVKHPPLHPHCRCALLPVV